MPSSTYLPTRESDLITWSNNFQGLIVSGFATYGLDMTQATDYTTAQSAFVSAHQVANNPDTRSPGNIGIKNTKKQALVTMTRQLVDICQASPVMDNDKRIALGITVRDNTPTPIPPPTEMPVLRVKEVIGRLLELSIRNKEDQKQKPEGAHSAWLYSHVGPNPSPDLTQWMFRGESTRSDPTLDFDLSVEPGTEVWVTALWVSPTGKPGPACAPVQTYTNRDGLSQAA